MRATTGARLVISSILAGVLIVAGALSPHTSPGLALIYALTLLLGFWLPAQGLGSTAEVRSRLPGLLIWTLFATLAWDVATAYGSGHRTFFAEWPLVYTSGPAVLLGLLFVHAWFTRRLVRRWAAPAHRE